jgi:RNA polymerase sigma factor (sigma-70 family)
MRAGDASAYEAIFRRHHEPLLSFCRHMLGGRDEAEDALQQAFIRAHRALLGPSPPQELRPWLYAIARNCCRTALAARRPETELDQEHPSLDGLSDEVARREDLRELVGDLGRLPEDQRSALLLAELEDLSHVEIAEIVGCDVSKVKALLFQARSALLADRAARDASCREIREELSVARGGQLRRGPLRRHLRLCAGCREFQQAIGQQRQAMAIVLPVAASAGLGAKILAHVAVGHTAAAAAGLAAPSIIGGAGITTSTGLGGTVAGGTASVAGGGAVAAGTTAAAGGGAVAAGGGVVAAGGGAVAASGGAVVAGATTASGGALAATGTTVAVVAGGGGAGATATAAAAAAGASTAVTTGVTVGGGVLAKLAVVGAVASLATAGAVAVHHRHRAPAAHRAVPARLAAVRHDTTHRLVRGGKVTTTSAVTAKQLRRRTAVAALRRNAAGVATTTQTARRKAARLAQKRRALAEAPAAGSTAPLGTGRPLKAAGPGTPLGASKGAANGAAGRKAPANGGSGRTVASGQTALQRSAAKQAAARRAAAKQRAARAAAAKAARAAKKTAAAAAAKKAAAAARKAAAAAKKAAARAARQAARRAAAQARRVKSATSSVRKARVGAAAAPATQTG